MRNWLARLAIASIGADMICVAMPVQLNIERFFVVISLIMCLTALSMPASAKITDLRTMTDAQGTTEVDFCARPSPNDFGFPGHAFVAFSEETHDGSIRFRAVGNTVAAGVGVPAVAISYFGAGPVAGKQADEIFTHVKQACLSVLVDRSVYNSALTAAQPTLTMIGIPADVAADAENYSLGSDDCLTFLIGVAQTLKPAGLQVPDRSPTDLPMSYVAKLGDAN